MPPYDPALALSLAEAAAAVYDEGPAFVGWAARREYHCAQWQEGAACAAVLVDTSTRAGAVLVTMRGTDDRLDWRVNTKCWRVRRSVWAPHGGTVHRGFATYADRLCMLITEEVERWPGRPVRVAGHSLGAGLAYYIAQLLERRGRDVVSVHAFCSPRVGDRQWATAYDEGPLGPVTHRVVITHRGEQDLVTRLPPSWMGYWHAGRPQIIVDGVRHESEAKWEELRRAQPMRWRVVSRLVRSVRAHPTSTLLAALRLNLEMERTA